jgi:hypothetical protein
MRVLACPLVLAIVLSVEIAPAAAESPWFVALPGHTVAPISRSEVALLYDAGVVETDGFRDMVISFGGEFKEGPPTSGRVGAILIPDHEITRHLLQNEGVFVFPTEIVYSVGKGLQGNFFMSASQDARIAFPRYRVYLYNETDSAASMSVFVYRSR